MCLLDINILDRLATLTDFETVECIKDFDSMFAVDILVPAGVKSFTVFIEAVGTNFE